MIKASLATDYIINFAPPPIRLISIRDVGDGQSLQVNWEPGALDQLDHYMMYYGADQFIPSDSILIHRDSGSYIIGELNEGVEYFVHIIGFDENGTSSIAYDQLSGIPLTKPALPELVTAKPLVGGIQLNWRRNNLELDFDHYRVIRDEILLPDSVNDTAYSDMAPILGSDIHEYLVVAVDTDGNLSDTAGAAPAISKAATLQAGRILAINRSGSNAAAMVDEIVTGEFIREALEGYTYDYFSDTSSSNPDRVDLLEMIDYSIIIIGAEAGRQDDIGKLSILGGILDDIAYYLSIGGRAIIFGRWGDISINEGEVDTIDNRSAPYLEPYNDYFHMQSTVQPLTYIDATSFTMNSDFIGAHGQFAAYPDLIWDSAATANHTDNPTLTAIGIPCASYPVLAYGWSYEIIYTYNSANDSVVTEGQPVAWRYLGGQYEYVFFGFPLSFIDRPTAVTALRMAITDLGLILDADDMVDRQSVPNQFELSQNYPNPFNPQTTIKFNNPLNRTTHAKLEIFNILGQHIVTLINGPVLPGRHRIEWDGADDEGNPLATGIYFYRLKANDGFVEVDYSVGNTQDYSAIRSLRHSPINRGYSRDDVSQLNQQALLAGYLAGAHNDTGVEIRAGTRPAARLILNKKTCPGN
jgi:hypothetical protein